jgi:hypothetical protein
MLYLSGDSDSILPFAIIVLFFIVIIAIIGLIIGRYNKIILQKRKRKSEENRISIQQKVEFKLINNQQDQLIISKLLNEISNNVLIKLLTRDKARRFAATQSLTAIDSSIYQSLLIIITRFEYYNIAATNNEQFNADIDNIVQINNDELCYLLNNLSEYEETRTINQQYDIIKQFLDKIYVYNINLNKPQTKLELLLTPVIHKAITSTNVQTEKTDNQLQSKTKQKLSWPLYLIIFILIFLLIRIHMHSYDLFAEFFVVIVSVVFASISTVIILAIIKSIKSWFE